MTGADSFVVGPEEFRRQGHQSVDWVADYLANLEKYPVASTVTWMRLTCLARCPAGEWPYFSS